MKLGGLAPLAQNAFPALIMIAGIALSSLAFREAESTDDSRARNVLELRAEWRARDFQDKITDASVPVEAMADFIPSQSTLDSDEFHRFAIQARREDPILRLVWAPLVTRGARARFEAEARQSGLDGYAISEMGPGGVLHPAAEHDEYLPMRLLERFDNSRLNLGFDLLTDKIRSAIVLEARDRGEPVAAPPIKGLSIGATAPNYIIFWPVYATRTVPGTLEERRSAFSGVVIGVYPVDAMMKFAIQDTPEILGTLSLFVDQAPDKPLGVPAAVYHSDNETIEQPAQPIGTPPPGGLRLMRTFTLFDHNWTLVSDYPAETVDSLRSSSQWGYLALGLLLTFGVGAYVLLEQRRRYAVETEVAERTRDLREASARLRGTTDQMKAIIDASPLAIIAIDATHIVTHWNRAAEQLFGYGAQEMVGHPYQPGVGPDPAEYQRRFKAATEGKILQGLQTQRQRKDGKLIDTISSVAAFFDAGGAVLGTVATIEDVTERNAMQRQLQQAQKMEAIGQLTGGLAHDFNNLLGVVIGNLDILQDTLEPGGDQRALAYEAIHAAVRGAELTRQLLAFARQQPLAPKRTDLNIVLKGATQLLRRTLGEQITLELKVAEALAPVLVDASQLESAILNLAVNARDAMPQGGQLTVEATNVTLDDGAAELNPEAAPGAYVAIAVSDTGTGMPPEIMAKAFDPFFTTKGGKGTGLGLSMVHGFVRQSGGHTKIYSEPGRGTTIRMYLPCAEDDSPELEASSPTATLVHRNEVILVVEDNKGLRDIGLRQLQRLGYRTLPAADANQALEIIQGGAPIDLLFTDVVMPGGMDGRGLAEAARRLRPTLKVLFTSGFTAAAASAVMTDEFGFNLLSKPYRAEELGRRVRAVLDAPEE